MSKEVDDAKEEIMELVDRLGSPPMNRSSWIELLEEIEHDCAVRREAAEEEEMEDGGDNDD